MCRISRLYHDADLLARRSLSLADQSGLERAEARTAASHVHSRHRVWNAASSAYQAPRRTAVVLFGTSLYHLQSTNTRSTGAHGMSAMWAGAWQYGSMAVRELQ